MPRFSLKDLQNKTRAPLSPVPVYNATKTKVVVSNDGVLKRKPETSEFPIVSDMEPFTFNLYFPNGETLVASEDFVPFYGSHRRVWDALKSGKLHFNDATAPLDLIEYFYKNWPSEMSQIPSIAYKAKAIGW